ncbi:MAG: hypothetical protein KJS83_12045, partial [Xanthomonadaceae bacterium]|nr:hypothetical protein [Xanthomonadaceae bacterium]
VPARRFVAVLRWCAGLPVISSTSAIHGLTFHESFARVIARCFVVALRGVPLQGCFRGDT